jgi:hypothetical protein
MRRLITSALLSAVLLSWNASANADPIVSPGAVIVAQSEPPLSHEEAMRRRFPQPVRVGDLIGLPVLDWGDSTIGRVRQVVRTPAGKIALIVGVGGWFGIGARPVAVPLEVVAILARQIDALDMTREEIETAPTWDSSKGQPVGANEMIRIALARR